MKIFTGVHSSRGLESVTIMMRNMVAGSQAGMGTGATAERLHMTPKEGGREKGKSQRRGRHTLTGMAFWNLKACPPPSDILFQQGHTS